MGQRDTEISPNGSNKKAGGELGAPVSTQSSMRASKWKGGKPEAALFPTPHLSWQQNSKFKTSALGW